MNNRAFLLYGLLFLLLVVVQATVFVARRSGSSAASILCRATNAGLPLDDGSGQVRIYVAGRVDQIVAEGGLSERIEVPPGSYDVRVVLAASADQHAVQLEQVSPGAGEQLIRDVMFSAGELSVEAMVGAGAAGTGTVVAYVFRSDDHDRIIASMAPGERVLIASGAYDLRVVLTVESKEKDVRWLHDVEVKAAAHTQRAVAFERGILSVKATNGGTPLTPGAVTLTIYRAGDAQREVLDSGVAGTPFGLAVGSYDVEAIYDSSSDRPSRWLRGLEIIENETLEQQVDFSSGTVQVSAELENGGPLEGFQVYVYYYRTDEHKEPVSYTPAGRPVVLQSGRYDVRASFFRSHDQPDIWLRNIQLETGEVVTRTVRFPSGKLLVRAYDGAGAELIGDNVFVYVYATGHRRRPIATARSGEIIILTEGSYDLRVEDTRGGGQERWLGDVRARSGELLEESVTFADATRAIK